MPGGLLQPVVPGATSIGQVIAQATAAATAQSAQILSAARNIAADRQRAGEMAADAVVRMRLEDFQKEQFRQKQSIENARLGIALAANQRAEAREPLERQLLQAEIDQAPLRTALIGAQLTGAHLGNTFDAARLLGLPEDRELQRRLGEARIGSAEADYKVAQREADVLNNADRDIGIISALMSNTDLTNPSDLSFALGSLNSLKQEAESGGESAVLDDPRVTELYNAAVEKIAPTDDVRDQLMISPDVIDALRPETTTSMGLRTETEKRMRIDAERDSKISTAEAEIRILKSKKEALKGQTSKDAKTMVADLDRQIQEQEKQKKRAEDDFQKKLQGLTRGLELPTGDGTPTPELVTPTTQSEVMDYLTRGVN